MVNELKKCKFCGEEILDIAVKCKHCGSNLNEAKTPHVKQDNGEILGTFLLLIPFIATLLMWFWIGEMNLLQSPGSKLNFIAIGTIILTGIIAAIEANQLGFGQNKTKSGKMSESSPIGYFFGFVLLWIIVYPLYLYKRSTKGKKNLVFGGIIVAIIYLISYVYLQNIIDDRVLELKNVFR